jgi:hypothetical protein
LQRDAKVKSQIGVVLRLKLRLQERLFLLAAPPHNLHFFGSRQSVKLD